MKLRILGAHNSETQNKRHISILIDDLIVLDAGCITTELNYDEQKKIQAILLTHGHYDHIKTIPSYAFNNMSKTTKIYASKETHDILASHLMDGVIYPKFNEKLSFSNNHTLKQITIESKQHFSLLSYSITPLPVNHIQGSFGFEIKSKDKKKIFYTGDTGPHLEAIWKHISPDLLIIDVTFPDKFENYAKDSNHLCPLLLKNELLLFKKINKYLPRVIAIHLSPVYELAIKNELSEISGDLNHPIEISTEGQKIII